MQAQNYLAKSMADLTIENYMPYAVHVILERAIPEIDGLKPSQRRVLYTMYKLKLFNKKVKSAVVVGETMKLHPHGDQTIYDTLVRLTDAYNACNTPFIAAKGTFGKSNSEMQYAAPRYTECGLADIAKELFEDIDFVDYVPSFDDTSEEPMLLSPKFPNILTNLSSGIAVGMTSDIPSYNFNELLNWVIEYVKNGREITSVLIPDFPTGGQILYNQEENLKIFLEGQGTTYVRAKYDVEDYRITFYSLPYGCKVEKVLEQVAELANSGKVPYITGVMDDIDRDDIKLSVEFDCSPREYETAVKTILLKLYKYTDLEQSMSSLIRVVCSKDSKPEILSVPDVVNAWLDYREYVLSKRFAAELKALEESKELFSGLVTFLKEKDAVEELVPIIRQQGMEAAERYLRGRFNFSKRVIDYILGIKLGQLDALELRDFEFKLDHVNREIERVTFNLGHIEDYIVKQLEELLAKYGHQFKRNSEIVYQYTRLQDMSSRKNRPEDTGSYKVIINGEGFIRKVLATSDPEYNAQEDVYLECKGTDILLLFVEGEIYKLYLDEVDVVKKNSLGVFIPKLFGLQSMNISTVIKLQEGMSTIMVYDNGKLVKVDHNELVYERRISRLQRGYKHFEDSEIMCIVNADLTQLESNSLAFIGTYEGGREVVKMPSIAFKSRLGSTKIFMQKKTGTLSDVTCVML